MNSIVKQGLLGTVTGALAMLVAMAPGQAAPFFEGKTVTVIVGFSPGGGSDLAARAIATHLGKHIEGSPNVVVKNLPGAGSMKAANFIYEKAPKDGTTVFFGPWYLLSQAMKVRGLRAKYDELTMIAPSRSPGGFVAYMRKDAVPGGYNEPKDILKAKRLRLAGVSPTSSLDRRLQLSFANLGVDFVHITGHRGLARASQSVRRGEMQASALALSAYNKSVVPNMVKPGVVVPLFYWALEDAKGTAHKNPLISGIPTYREFYEQVHGKKPSGELWDTYRVVNSVAEVATHNLFGPPEMPDAATAALRKGFVATLNDPSYIKQAVKIASYAHEAVDLGEARSLIGKVKAVDPNVYVVLKRYANPERKKRAKKKN